MLGVILAFRERGIGYLTPLDDEPMVSLVERRLGQAKRIGDVLTVVPSGKVKRYSLHVGNPIGVRAKNEVEALLNALPRSGEVFLVRGNMPLLMPFLVNYLSTLFLESDAEALIPRWANGSLEVTHAFYEVEALRATLDACLAEGESRISCIPHHLDYEPVSIEELSARNPKVTLSFFKVRTPFDLRFAEKNLENGGV
ncbi:molybdenum cofactor guanylyltransferase [Palaeococcus ferrophilus]|uniref:molybdenum cofactor guanylyltransferase n=1 Tax=Palaeococcus ferrophilus TaxID=83868 RepID=UPI00064E6823|nr:NTP transferase domain-containing protein [Palaeococcus ferrophilus]